MLFPFSLMLFPLVAATYLQPEVSTLDYGYFSLQFNCSARSPIRWSYSLEADHSDLKRPYHFTFDPNFPRECQQLSTATYSSDYDRGHLVSSNEMDIDTTSVKIANYMTNILPQAKNLNRNQWRVTEAITDCYRDLAPVQVFGGVIYNENSNELFLKSHGVRTPSFMWKVLVTTDIDTNQPKAIAWLFPNSNDLGPVDQYRTTVFDIESKVNDGLGEIPIEKGLKGDTLSNWPIPKGCTRN